MAINFTKNVEQYTTINKSTREKHFTEYTSKKQLENADVLTAEELTFVKELKGTFSFALHEGGRYMAITLYKANADKKYTFLIVDLQEQAVAEVDSIKNAKAEIMELVSTSNVVHINEEELAENEDEEVAENEDEELAQEA